MINKDFYLASFKEVEHMLAPFDLGRQDLEVAVGEYYNSMFIKLYKKAWANPSDNLLTSPSRIFFSVWIDTEDTGKLCYNIHALKLRHLKGYKLESRKFADVFRTEFRPFEKQWPNVSTKFGPLTLMQGNIPITQKEIKPESLKLCKSFLNIQHLIDDTLAKCQR